MLPVPLPNLFGSPLLVSGGVAGVRFDAGVGQASSRGALAKAGWLVVLTAATMLVLWAWFYPATLTNDKTVLRPLGQVAFACGVVAMSLVFVGRYKTGWLPWIAPIYALFAAIFLGGISLGAEADLPGIGLNTAIATVGVFVVMASGYALRIFRPTARFRAGLFSVTAAIALVYLAAFALSFAGIRLPLIHDAGWGGILWSGFICTIAAMHLLVDFQSIEQLDKSARPKMMEWYAALGLVVTLVWLYLFLLRLVRLVQR